jgi:uncharacterized repeat protein (TIGR01451 family)
MDGIVDRYEIKSCPSCQYDPDPDDDTNPLLDLVSMGSSTWVKDVFVEVDYLEAAGHSHAPNRNAIEAAVQAFANANVENVNYVYYGEGVIYSVARNVDSLPGAIGTYGDLRRLCERRINICDPLPVSAVANGGGDAIAEAGNEHLGYAPPAGSTGAADFYDLKDDNFDDNYRLPFFHYTIFGHQVWIDPADVDIGRPRQPCISGRAEVGCLPADLGGNDLMVTLGGNDRNGNVCWPDASGDAVGDMTDHLGTFTHELGHNLGIQHGGGDDINFKPNYYSVMNYLFQFPGIPANHQPPLISGHDYSRLDCPTLDETSLDECVGIGCLPIHGARDWDGDGVDEGASCTPLSSNVAAEINFDDPPNHTDLHGFEDWNDLLTYDFQTACTYEDGNPGTVHDEQDPEQVEQARQFLDELLRANLVVTKTAVPDQVMVGETITYTIRITNKGAGPAEKVVVTDILPDNTKKVFEVGALQANTKKEITIEYLVTSVTANCGTIRNEVMVEYHGISGKKKRVVASAKTEIRANYEYAAKLICGVQPEPEDMRLAQGFYATTINIHNPDENAFSFCKKLALTYPPGKQVPGEVFTIGSDTLKPDEALAVDCMDIEHRLFPKGLPTPYIEGFVVIQSPESLDIAAVYTTARVDKKGNVMAHSSVDVEQIRERRRQKKPTTEPPPVERPDLTPAPDPQLKDQYCKFKDGLFVVTVRNQGAGAAGPSTTEVIDLDKNETFSMPTPALEPGTSTNVNFHVPRNYGAFEIRVDAKSEVSESNEENNIAIAHCLG